MGEEPEGAWVVVRSVCGVCVSYFESMVGLS